MAKRPVLTDISSGFGTTDTINANNTAIETWADNTVSRDGSSPNDMQADFDLGGHKLLNVARGVFATDGINLSQLTELISGSGGLGDISYNGFNVSNLTATPGQDIFDPGFCWTPGLNQIQVFVDGVLQSPDTYTENNDCTITFDTPLEGGEVVTIQALNLSGVTQVTTEIYDIGFAFEGNPAALAEVALPLPRACALPTSSLSVATAEAAATATTVFSIQRNGSEVGTVTFAAAGTTGTISVPTEVVFAAGDRLSIQAPDPADDTIESVGITLALRID